MGISSKFKNLNKVLKKLRHRKLGRAKEIIRDYGMAELLRRVREKMNYGDSAVYKRVHIITNESYIKNMDRLRSGRFRIAEDVSFDVLPGSISVSRLDIATRCSDPNAVLTLRISDMSGKTFLETQAKNIANDDYTVFEFLPVLEVLQPPDYQPQRLRFTLHSSSADCGVLIDSNSSRRGFNVEGGGRLVCRIYSRPDAHYVHWLKNNTPTQQELDSQRSHKFGYSPKFSVIVPLFNTPAELFKSMVLSVTGQTYANWELCLADGSTEDTGITDILADINDERIIYKKLDENKGISGNSNEAIKMSTGDYVCFLDHDDMLMPHALYSNAALINSDIDYEFIYSDEDKITEDGSRRMDPFFKPDFSPDMFFSFNYITHFTVISRKLLDRVGYFDGKYNGAQDYDLFLRATEQAKKIGHISDILYHWRIAPTSTAFSSDTKSYTVEAGRSAIEAAVKRRGLKAHVKLGVLPNYYNVVYDIPEPQPMISIIIPNHNEAATLRKCIDSILEKTTYKNYEIIIAENNSTDKKLFNYYKTLESKDNIKIVTWNHPFNFSALNNFAASHAKGELLLFLNNDMSVISRDWLGQMAMHACRSEIGAVGAKLLYPDNTVQHGGIILRIGGVAGHSHKFADMDDVGSFARMALVHDVSAVTAACLMVRRELFDKVGGFDEKFVVACNDVDFCLKLRALGFYNLWTPYAKLYHYESKTRGYEDTPEKEQRFNAERRLWLDKWSAAYPYDPFYNRNLTLVFQDYSVNPGSIPACHCFDDISPQNTPSP